jgi:molybdopterin/thiamine biosynthesis adenylyltransferase
MRAIWLHTHPGDSSSARPSPHDEIVDQELADLFRLRTGSVFYGALVLAHQSGQLRFAGHIESEHDRFDIDRVWITGRRFTLTHNALHRTDALPHQFDRHIRAFGGDVQRVLRDLSVAVVGAGGTGSSVAERLVRLGVRRFQLFDPDQLSASNVTRVYGSTPADIGASKVDILARHLRGIAPDAEVMSHIGMITREDTAKALLDADVVFGCTDDNAGRLVLSRLTSFTLTPVIDSGVLLTSGTDGQLLGIDGRVTVLAPGAACLVCRNRVDLKRAAAEMRTPDEHHRLAGEGYAPALAGVEPAVVAYTTQVAAAAVGELIERLVHYGPEPVVAVGSDRTGWPRTGRCRARRRHEPRGPLPAFRRDNNRAKNQVA